MNTRTLTHGGSMVVLTCTESGMVHRTNNAQLMQVLEAKKHRTDVQDTASINKQLRNHLAICN
jgi:hypothetical protein